MAIDLLNFPEGALSTVGGHPIYIFDGSSWVALTGEGGGGPGNSTITLDFSGVNGDPFPAPLDNLYASSGANAEIQGNRGRFTVGNLGDYEDFVAYGFTPTSQSFEVTGEFHMTQMGTEGYARFAWRVDNNLAGMYILDVELESGAVSVIEQSPSWSLSYLAWDILSGVTLNSVVYYRVRVEGTNYKIRVWRDSQSEPGTWTYEFTDTTFTSGYMMWCLLGGVAGAQRTVDIDNITITYLGTGGGSGGGDS